MVADSSLEVLKEKFLKEPYARWFGIDVLELEPGRARVTMRTSDNMSNLFGSVHGGGIYSLFDAAFELTVNSHGTVAVALSVNVSYVSAAKPGETLTAECREVHRSRRISTCESRVTGEDGRLVATCHALAYRKEEALSRD
jgi:acyl-CoA thioesterase